jgi:TRAP-type mannitol/chloroaromatic compound transport system permease large subunit
MNLTSPFSLAMIAIVGLSLTGLPVAYAMIGGSILWLFASHLDMGTAAEQLLNGMMASQLLLAIPLFILAAEFMNTGQHHGQAAALLQRDRRDASAAGLRRSTWYRA